jgi:hypothetical protein
MLSKTSGTSWASNVLTRVGPVKQYKDHETVARHSLAFMADGVELPDDGLDVERSRGGSGPKLIKSQTDKIVITRHSITDFD